MRGLLHALTGRGPLHCPRRGGALPAARVRHEPSIELRPAQLPPLRVPSLLTKAASSIPLVAQVHRRAQGRRAVGDAAPRRRASQVQFPALPAFPTLPILLEYSRALLSHAPFLPRALPPSACISSARATRRRGALVGRAPAPRMTLDGREEMIGSGASKRGRASNIGSRVASNRVQASTRRAPGTAIRTVRRWRRRARDGLALAWTRAFEAGTRETRARATAARRAAESTAARAAESDTSSPRTTAAPTFFRRRLSSLAASWPLACCSTRRRPPCTTSPSARRAGWRDAAGQARCGRDTPQAAARRARGSLPTSRRGRCSPGLQAAFGRRHAVAASRGSICRRSSGRSE